MTSYSWATLANWLVYSAMAVYGMALVVFAADRASAALAARRGRATPVQPLAVARARAAGPGPSAGVAGRQSHAQSTRRRGAEHEPAGERSLARLGAIGTGLTVLAFSLHIGAVTARGVASGRLPWGNMYEFAVLLAASTTAAFLALSRRGVARPLGVWVCGAVLTTLGLAVTVLYTPSGALVPVLNSYWLLIHVAAAITAGGIFTVGALGSAVLLVRGGALRDRRRVGTPSGLSPVSPGGRLEELTHAAHVFAFPIWTFAVVAGAVWAENAWGRYWGWDPKETWAFITWVFYAAYLHAQSTAGWRGRRANWFALAGYLALLFNFVGVNLWVGGLHSYAGV